MKTILKIGAILVLFGCVGWCSAQTCLTNAQVTLAGTLRSSNGLPSSNYVMTLQPSQQGYIAGCGVNVPTVATCGTSTDGSVIGIPNPNTATSNTTAGTGTLPSAVYYTVYAFYDALGNQTLISPETRTTLSATGSLVVNAPASGIPSNATGMRVYISTVSGAETLQGSTVGIGSFVQSVPLVSGASPSGSNTTLCKLTANDAIWPTGTGYNVGMVDTNGNTIPGYPMQWQLIGPGTTINLSNGLPYYHGVVTYPTPILSAPQNHGAQSISGPLNLAAYNLVNVGKVGIGTSTPGYPLDVENGVANASGGYLINGAAGSSGQAPCSDGTAIDTFCTFLTSATLNYQTVKSNGTGQTPRPALNFTPRFTLSDSASPAQTNVDLATVGSAATYTLTYNGISYNNYAVDAYGRVVGTNNIVLPTLPAEQALIIASGICTTANTAYAQCSFSPTWSTAFADTNYAVSCSPNSLASNPAITGLFITAKATTGFTITLQNGDSSGANATTLTEIDCIGRHL